MLGLLLCLVFLSSFLVTFGVKKYAHYFHIMDLPNHRSSHAMPTPRGGGLGFVLVFLITLFALCYLNSLKGTAFLAIGCAERWLLWWEFGMMFERSQHIGV